MNQPQNIHTKAQYSETLHSHGQSIGLLNDGLKSQFLELCSSLGLYFSDVTGVYQSPKSTMLTFILSDAEKLMVLARGLHSELVKEGK